jgi:flagellar hook-associated protein 1 FlgK
MSSGILAIANSALAAAQTALRTTGNNIANVNTPGYSRQVVELVPQQGSAGGFFVGQGVAVAGVRRAYDALLTNQAHQATAASGAARARALQLGQLQNLFAEPDSSVGAAIDQFFRAVHDLSQRPADPAARQALLGSARQLAARFNDAGDRMQELRHGTDQQLRLETDRVNRAAQEIAQLNGKIALALGSGRNPNELLDQRDAAIRRLSESLQVTTVAQDDGSVNLFLASGQALVVGGAANTLALASDASDPTRLGMGVMVGSQLTPLPPDRLGGGRIAGLMQFRNDDLPRIENELGRLAVALTSALNAQHRLGNDRNGAAGGDLFLPLLPEAFAAPDNGNPATQVSAAFVDATQLVASDYRLSYSAGQYTLTRLADGQAWTAATPAFTEDGLAISLGPPAALPPAEGDSFLIRPFRGASRNLALAIAQPAAIAAAAPVVASAAAGNGGSLVVDDLSALSPRSPNLAAAATITFGPGNTYTVVSGPVTQSGTYTPGLPIDFDGRWRITLHGAPQPGDEIHIGPSSGSGDNRNLLRLAQLQSAALLDGAPPAAAFAAAVAKLGAEVQGAQFVDVAQQGILDAALNAESSVSGVNLDEEASRLIQYQQQYQAAAKLMAIAGSLFDELLSIGR